jgi:hypothetical protein
MEQNHGHWVFSGNLIFKSGVVRIQLHQFHTEPQQLSLILCHKLFVQSSTTIHHMSERYNIIFMTFSKEKTLFIHYFTCRIRPIYWNGLIIIIIYRPSIRPHSSRRRYQFKVWDSPWTPCLGLKLIVHTNGLCNCQGWFYTGICDKYMVLLNLV